jgi:hypothetical protein
MTPNEIPAGRLGQWLQRHRRDALDLAALAVALIATDGFVAAIPPSVILCALVAAALIPLRPAPAPAGPWREFLAAAPRRLVTVGACAILLHYWLALPFGCLWFGAIWPAVAWLAIVDWRRVWKWARGWTGRNRWFLNPTLQEALRMVFLAASALWLLQGFLRLTLHGAADAQWYSMTMADAVTQERAGVFPIWVGQSVYQFNGSVLPVRVAPAFQYLGVILDVLTFRSLGVFAIQNTLIVLLGVGAMAACYLGLCELLPRRRWLAAGLALLFFSCPGVLGLPYNGDLYMSWTAVPLVPMVWFATVRSFADRGSLVTVGFLGATLGLSWWGHSPIAIWSTVLAAGAQVARIAWQWRGGVAWKPLLLGALAFGAIAAYPVCSVLLYPAEPNFHAGAILLAEPGRIATILHGVYPASMLPLSPAGRSLSDFQVGYALWALLIFAVWGQRRKPVAACAVAFAAAVFLGLLLLPFISLETILWTAVPGFIRSPTTNWPMFRLCLPAAGAIVFGAAAYAADGMAQDRRSRLVLSILVAGGCAWSFSEAVKFSVSSRLQVPRPDSAVDALRPENVQLSRYSYGFFPHYPELPSTFTHGVTDPELENHLIASDMSSTITANADAAMASGRLEATYDFVWSPQGPSHHAYLNHRLRLEAGAYYLLQFDFKEVESIHGVLQLLGPHFFREYALPEHGAPKSFGAGGSHSSLLPVRSTSGTEDIVVSFYPSPPIPENPPIARVRLFRYDRNALPVRVDDWMPFRARVRSPAAAWLETPRVYQTGYQAQVDGRAAEVKETPDALVAVAVPAGESSVELAYVPPASLRLLFWLSFLSAIAAVLTGTVAYILHLLGRPSPAKAYTA